LLASVVSSEGRIKSPLEIRPVPKEYKNQTKCPYMLVAGFRRYMVALELKIPLVPCLIEEMTEAAARLRNIQENSTHENLRTCDQSWAIGQIKNKATQQEIAQKCGLSQPYVGKLLAIYDGLIPSVFKLWREQTLIKIPIAEIIELAKQPKDQQETSFRNLITEASKSRKGGAGKAAWVDAAIRKAHQFGSLLGRLARVGLVKVEENKDQWENRDVEKVIRLGKDANDEQVNSILEALLAGYKQSRDAKEKTTEGDTGETSIN
jgi:ParB/RepB/Spo0J family partition protein